VKTEPKEKIDEYVYHVFLLGLLGAYRDSSFDEDFSKLLSNRESGDGRYDILFLRPEYNYLFELKSCGDSKDLAKYAEEALAQIQKKRYAAEVPQDKEIILIGIAFCGKNVEVCCAK
jgi:hypothetical protein